MLPGQDFRLVFLLTGAALLVSTGFAGPVLADDRCNHTAWTYKGPNPATREICVLPRECSKGNSADVICQGEDAAHCPQNNDCEGNNACKGGEDGNDKARNWVPAAAAGTKACKGSYVPCVFTVNIPAAGALNCKCTCGNRGWTDLAAKLTMPPIEPAYAKIRRFQEPATGNKIELRGNNVVVRDARGTTIKQFKSSTANIQARINSGKWVPLEPAKRDIK
jgi:hypothetical protein